MALDGYLSSAIFMMSRTMEVNSMVLDRQSCYHGELIFKKGVLSVFSALLSLKVTIFGITYAIPYRRYSSLFPLPESAFSNGVPRQETVAAALFVISSVLHLRMIRRNSRLLSCFSLMSK